jgi:prepilin-type N-terminal cleavage/methylation domain-containing protein
MIKIMRPMARMRARARSSQGFTLVELLVTMMVASILAGAMIGLYLGVIRSVADTQNRIINQDDARTAMNEIARYVRMASSSASNQTSITDAVALAGPQEMVFFADINGDGISDKVRFYLDGTTMRMATVAPNTSHSPATYPAYSSDGIVVMHGIRNGTLPIFTYYQTNPAFTSTTDAAHDTLVAMTSPTSAADLAKIVAVGFTVYINEQPALSKGNVKLDSLIQIRQRYNGGLGGN